MISLLLPTRKRCDQLTRLHESLRRTSYRMPEVVVYVDDDDPMSALRAERLGMVVVQGPRIRRMTEYWNRCYEVCKGDIVCQCNDDVVFRTQDWDIMLEKEFAKYDDRIVMVHGSDAGLHYNNFGPHPFVHRKWVDTLGYFIPPYFVSDYGDTWINELADKLDRRVYLPFVMEHMHFLMGKSAVDETHQERLARHDKDDPEKTWWETLPQRNADVAKLQAVIMEYAERCPAHR